MISLATPTTTTGGAPPHHRFRGWGLIVIETLLSIGIVAIGLYFWTLISSDTVEGLGSYAFTIHTLELFTDVFILGLVAAIAGIYQLRQQRSSQTAMVLLLVLMALMFYLGSTLMTPT
jgi:ABC-type tungstate transport system substrate-binding protein